MSDLKARIASLVRAQRENYLVMFGAIVNPPGRKSTGSTFGADEVAQMVDGWTAMVTESLEDRGSEARDMYVGIMVPGVIAAGVSLATLMRVAVQACVHVTADLVLRLPESDRAEATAWLSEFYGRYFTELTRAGLKALAEKA